MIRIATADRVQAVTDFCERSPYGVRIAANLLCYGTDRDFARFWYGESDGRLTSAISRVDGNMSVHFTDGADVDELVEFVRTVGFGSLLCPRRLYTALGLDAPEDTNIMRYSGGGRGGRDVSYDGVNFSPLLEDVWSVISAIPQFGLSADGFTEWYADMSHKVRHGGARAVMYKDIGAATVSSETEKTALISAVAVREDARGRGAGKMLVSALTQKLGGEGKDIFLFCGDGLTEFYSGMGFALYK